MAFILILNQIKLKFIFMKFFLINLLLVYSSSFLYLNLLILNIYIHLFIDNLTKIIMTKLKL